eukprot:g3713.t1
MMAYREWLQAEPVQRLYIRPRVPVECSGVWSRLEQRGQLMLINAVPQSIKAEILSSRTTSSVEVLYALFRRYQPGGLAERSRLLRQLVEPKTPQTMNEVVEALRGWRRSLRRAQELEIATPDATLLLGALDRMSDLIGRTSSQVAFRMSSTRAALGVDVTPNLETVLSFSDMLTAEAESLVISELQPTSEVKASPIATKVKAMTATADEKGEKGSGKAKSEGKTEEKICRFWGSEDGCRKGQECRFKHDWSNMEKKGRCFGCSSTKHTKKECPTVKSKADTEKHVKTFKKEGDKGIGTKKIEREMVEESPPAASEDVVDEKKVERPAASSGEVQALLTEATTLLKSLRPATEGSKAIKSIKLSSLEVRTNDRALLDGGATHCLRRAESEEEWQRAQEVRVELAEGSVLLRQIPWTKTLLTQNEVQTIVPLGVLISLGYEAYWEKDRFTLTDSSGALLDVAVEGMCPTVDEGLGRELIREIERSMVRERARLAVLSGEENQGGLEWGEVHHLRELRELFPEVPLRLLVRILPKVGWTGETLPWNRHERRKVRRAREVVVHLFSGDTKKYWQRELEHVGRAVLCVDTVIDPGMNILRDDVFAYLLEIADGGTLRALLGGPPCRTMSRLRYRQPGPPPLREREGPGRFGLPNLDPVLKQQVEDDTLLWLRQVYLHHRASKAASPEKVATALEQPDDPEAYLGESKREIGRSGHQTTEEENGETDRHPRYPTYWSWPEWQTVKKLWDLFEVRFDQGRMGHSRRKPTRLGTNMPRLRELEGLRGPGHGAEDHRGDSIQERIARSKSWAAWAPGLKAALVVAVRESLEKGDPQLRRMDLNAWQKHLLNGHLPYSRECRACVVAASKSKAHRRVPHPDAYTLSIDTAGPFEAAEDQLGKGRYLLVGVYLAPVTKDGQSLIPINEEDELPGALGDGPELTVVETEEEGGLREEWPGLDDEKAWMEKVEAERDFQVKQILVVEVLENRGGPAVVEAVGRMAAKLDFLGLPVKRLHSDRAGEYQSRAFHKWCHDRGIMRTFNDGDNFKGNGRAENAIAQVKRGARTLLIAAGLDESFWCHAARHWAEGRLRRQLESMGWKRRELAPFGQVVWAKRKYYSDRQKYLSTTRTQVRVLCPAVTMSMTTPGYLVQEIESGKMFHTGDIIQVGEAPAELEVPEREAGFIHEVDDREEVDQPRKRPGRVRKCMRLLQEPAEGIQAVDWGELHHRGARHLAQELTLLEEDEGEIVNERFIKMLTAEVEEIAEKAMVQGRQEETARLIEAEQARGEGQEFLQTRMVGLAEVRKNLEEWRPSMVEEYTALITESEAVEPIDRDRTDQLKTEAETQGKDFDLVPAKAIFSRKAGSGRHKCRGVACGNFMNAKSTESTFASGASGIEVRMLIKLAAVNQWSLATLDVKTAFLNAPAAHERGTVIVQPPRIFQEAGVLTNPKELWLVKKALYGLVTSPRDWCDHRDGKIKDFRWDRQGKPVRVQATPQTDIWLMQEEDEKVGWRTKGALATYVDDVLMVGEEDIILGFIEQVKTHWKIGEPEWVMEGREPVRFLGMEVEKRGVDYVIHQQAYITNLLSEYDETGRGALGQVRTPEEEEQPTADQVLQAQKETGELLWVAGRSRPDLSLGVGIMSQWASKRPAQVIKIGKQIRAHLKETLEEVLVMSADDGRIRENVNSDEKTSIRMVDIYTDASYGSSELKSISGVGVFVGGTPVGWQTTRQPFITLSTAEAELMAMLEGLIAGRSTAALLEAVVEEKAEVRLHSDSTAAIAIATGTTSSWRTRHLRIRAAGLTEAIREKEITLDHVSGKVLVADGFTKQLTGPALGRFKEALGLKGAEKRPVEVKKIEVHKGVEPGFTRGIGLLVAAASLLGKVEAATEEQKETTGEWWIVVLITAAIAVLVDIAFRVGTSGIQRWFKPKEEIKVKLLHPEARLPTRGSDQAAGLDLYSTIETLVPPGESVLIKTGLAVELPAGTYGRIAPRSSLAIRGIETGAGVVDRDFRGEVKVLLRNWSDDDLRVYKGDRVAQLVVERILEVGVNHVEDLSETQRGNRGFGYSAHEEAYPWAEPDDPLYQRQELGTSTPVDPYDAESEERRRAELGLAMSAWDRYMIRRGPRRDYGGTWVMLDSDGVHFVARDPGDGRGVNRMAESAAQGSGEQPQEGDGQQEEQPRQSLPRVEPLRLVTTVETRIVLGKWCHEEEMADYLRTPGFQKGLINEAVRRIISIPPRRTSAKDSWDYLIDFEGEKKIGIRVHYQDRKKLYDFEGDTLLEERWGKWRMTVAWHIASRRETILVNERNGKRGCLLDLWWGYTVFKTV